MRRQHRGIYMGPYHIQLAVILAALSHLGDQVYAARTYYVTSTTPRPLLYASSGLG